MAKIIKLPSHRSGHDVIELDDEHPLATIYPTEPILPKPSRFAFVNERMARRVKSYKEVVDSVNELYTSLTTHQRARARLDNVHQEVLYDREVLAYNLERIRKKRRELRAESLPQQLPQQKKQKPSPSLATMFGEEESDDE